MTSIITSRVLAEQSMFSLVNFSLSIMARAREELQRVVAWNFSKLSMAKPASHFRSPVTDLPTPIRMVMGASPRPEDSVEERTLRTVEQPLRYSAWAWPGWLVCAPASDESKACVRLVLTKGAENHSLRLFWF